MILIQDKEVKRQSNFWTDVLFHPTDAVEDPWGKRILDTLAEDRIPRFVRIYAMLEDIVYLDPEGNLAYDFRLSDLRLDYLVEKGFRLFIAYAGMPECIASSNKFATSVSKNKTRYKGKMFNTSPPKDPALWEEVCYVYTKHILDRYGLERVKTWRVHCFNEPDIPEFFLSQLPREEVDARIEAYCPMYEGFQRGVRRASEEIILGGPALANRLEFLGRFLDYVRQKNLKLDFISLHNYGSSVGELNDGRKVVCVENNIARHRSYVETIQAHGFGETPLFVDEWGISSGGFCNREECPALMFRESEVFSAYYAKLIHHLVYSDFRMDGWMICLSGQHEMVEDFSGFRNFFTLNFFQKPIYSAFRMATKLGESFLEAQCDRENVWVLPTRRDDGSYAVMLSYSDEHFTQTPPRVTEELTFREEIRGKKVTLWCIDESHSNPYALSQRLGLTEFGEEEIRLLREEGRMKPLASFVSDGSPISLDLVPNATWLVTVE